MFYAKKIYIKFANFSFGFQSTNHIWTEFTHQTWILDLEQKYIFAREIFLENVENQP